MTNLLVYDLVIVSAKHAGAMRVIALMKDGIQDSPIKPAEIVIMGLVYHRVFASSYQYFVLIREMRHGTVYLHKQENRTSDGA